MMMQDEGELLLHVAVTTAGTNTVDVLVFAVINTSKGIYRLFPRVSKMSLMEIIMEPKLNHHF